jgi:hypothetical protein
MKTKVEIKKALMVVMLSGTLMWMACSTEWISEAEEIIAALIPATANLVTLAATLQGKNVTVADLQTIRSAGAEAGTGLQLMQSLIAEYQKADASAQPGLLNQIQVAMSAVQSTLNGLMPALDIKDEATQAKFAAVVGILLSEVESVAGIVPLLKTSSPGMMTMTARQVRKQPAVSAIEFASRYNATMSAKTGHSELDDATRALRIHVHGKLSRWASAGLLK